ncbi:MAG: glycosyltransferase family 4 protein, partial [Polyangiales bacterium]
MSTVVLVSAFLLATLASTLLIPVVRIVAFKVGAVSTPGGRHIHDRAIPRLGGVAIACGFCIGLGILAAHDMHVREILRDNASLTLGLLTGGAIMSTVGVIDDTRGLRAALKLAAQIAVAVGAYAAGFRITAVSLPFVGDLSMGIFALPVTTIWIVGIVNAINLIDGLDGLAAGVTFFAGITGLVVAKISGTPFTALMMATMLGAVLGFLFFNFNPARIFMGDSGSYFLGFVLAATSLVGSAQKTSAAVSILVPILALGVPILDTLFAMVRRILERRPIFSPDRGHIHHRLLDMGLTHRRAVMIIYAVCAVFTVTAIGVSLGRTWQVGVALFVASTA